jgi:hypothetical protein
LKGLKQGLPVSLKGLNQGLPVSLKRLNQGLPVSLKGPNQGLPEFIQSLIDYWVVISFHTEMLLVLRVLGKN